jgi:hypothetical protein
MLPPQNPDMVPTDFSINVASGLTFLNRWFGLATILLSNLLAAAVVFIVVLHKAPKQLQRALGLITAAVFVISLLPAAMTLNYSLPIVREDASDSDKANFTRALLTVRALQMAGVMFNLACVSVVSWKIFSSRNHRKVSYPLTVLCLRLGTYPLIQGFTQFPLLWETFGVTLNRQATGPRTDDEFYTEPDYSALRFILAVLAPSAGLLFAAVFLQFQPGALASLLRLFRLFLEAVSLDKGVASKLFLFPEWVKSSSVAANERSGHSEGHEDQVEDHKQGQDENKEATVQEMSVKALSMLGDDELIEKCIREQNLQMQSGTRDSALDVDFVYTADARHTVLMSSTTANTTSGIGIELPPLRPSLEKRGSGTIARAVFLESQRLGGGGGGGGGRGGGGRVDIIPNPLRIPAATLSDNRRANKEGNHIPENVDKSPARLDPST